MPYKTRHGAHYHEAEGCCGATIPCSTENLVPCSICCNSKFVQNGQVQTGSSGGTAISGGAAIASMETDASAQPLNQNELRTKSLSSQQNGIEEIPVTLTAEGVIAFGTKIAINNEMEKIFNERTNQDIGIDTSKGAFTATERVRLEKAAYNASQETALLIKKVSREYREGKDPAQIIYECIHKSRMSEFLRRNPLRSIDSQMELIESRPMPDFSDDPDFGYKYAQLVQEDKISSHNSEVLMAGFDALMEQQSETNKKLDEMSRKLEELQSARPHTNQNKPPLVLDLLSKVTAAAGFAVGAGVIGNYGDLLIRGGEGVPSVVAPVVQGIVQNPMPYLISVVVGVGGCCAMGLVGYLIKKYKAKPQHNKSRQADTKNEVGMPPRPSVNLH